MGSKVVMKPKVRSLGQEQVDSIGGDVLLPLFSTQLLYTSDEDTSGSHCHPNFHFPHGPTTRMLFQFRMFQFFMEYIGSDGEFHHQSLLLLRNSS